jgi:predicted RNA methylase
MSVNPTIEWTEDGEARTARWHSEAGTPAPRRVVIADDTLTADTAFRLASEGTGLLWRGDFQNARQHRQAQSQRARTLNALLIPLEADYTIALRRSPEMREACEQVYGPADGAMSVASLRELQGIVGAFEWRKKGVEITVLGERIHPYYGVFSPVRGEYLDLVDQAPLPSTTLAFDIGTGTGVIAALLAKRGVQRIVATDQDERALACARDNIERLGYAKRVQVTEANLFPEGKAPLIVCNPPWVPAIFDPDSQMLKGFLTGLAAHLEPGGEGWLILSDLAEHIGLRSRDELLAWFKAAGLQVLDKLSVRPRHPKANDTEDPLYSARSREMTSLWRLSLA